MKLIRFGLPGQEKPGVVLDDGRRRDCSEHFEDWDRQFFQSGGMARLAALLASRWGTLADVPEETRWGACVARPGKVVCIGLNYRDHAAETRQEVPAEPLVFLKAPNAVVGPYDQVLIPRGSRKTDWEIELGVVIGRDARYLENVAAARDHIAGYCISHDISERHFQKERGGQMTKGKSCDTFLPLGPFLATPDELGDVGRLSLTLTVNGQPRQSGNTSQMVFDPFFAIHYLSQFMTLEAGDVISTGTPAGVGMGRTPPEYLRAGDVVELTIPGLGRQRQVCADA